MRNIVILNSLHFSYPLPILMRVSYNTLIVKQNTSDYYKYIKKQGRCGHILLASLQVFCIGQKLESKIYSKDRYSLILTILTSSYLIKNQQNYEIFQ